MKVFPGSALIELDPVKDINGIKVIGKRNKNRGKIIQSSVLNEGEEILFFAHAGVIMHEKALIQEEDITLTIKNNMIDKVFGKRVLVEPEKQAKELAKGIVASDAHRLPLPIGTVLHVGTEVKDIKVGDRIFFDKDRAKDFTDYRLIEGKIVFMVREDDVILRY